MTNEYYDEAYKAVQNILDEHSFVHLQELLCECNVITGYGTINDKLVFIYSQYGFVNAQHAKAISGLYQKALTMGAPVIGILNSSGMKLDEGLAVFEHYGEILLVSAKASGIIPQLNIVLSDTLGVASLIAGQADFVFSTAEPAVSLSSTRVSSAGNTLIFEDLNAITENVRHLINLLPSNHLEEGYSLNDDSINRHITALSQHNELAVNLFDEHSYINLNSGCCKNNTIAVGTLGGQTCGIIGLFGEINACAIKSSSKFVAFCNKFNIPIITFNDIVSLSNDSCEEDSMLSAVSELLREIVNATVPKINITTKTSYGAGMLIFNSKFIGADISFAINDSKIGTLNSIDAAKVLDISLIDTAVAAAKMGAVDNIFDITELRARVISASQMLLSKRELRYLKK